MRALASLRAALVCSNLAAAAALMGGTTLGLPGSFAFLGGLVTKLGPSNDDSLSKAADELTDAAGDAGEAYG